MKVDKFVVKIASRCNINCAYCYMYNLGDTSYKLQPKFISDETTDNFVEKLFLHIKKHDLKSVSIIMHGGEPLLMPKNKFISFIKSFNQLKEKNILVDFSLQTNGILIDDEWCGIFKEYKIYPGVSLDGNKEINDKYRVDKKGYGTYDDVIKGINLLKKNDFEIGTLSVMNLDADPIEFYNHFKSLNIRSIDVLLLDSNYDLGKQNGKTNLSPAEWYIKIFDKWFYESDDRFRIRFFNLIIRELLGDEQNIDILGVNENNVLVLETNGALEAVDVLKTCGESFTKNDLNINTNDIDDVFNSELIEIYYNSGKYLSKKCLACPIQELCGGGYLPHRYSSKNGFNNPSIYCDDLLKIITYIQNVVIDSMPNELVKETGLSKLTYEKAIEIIETNLPLVEEPIYISKLEQFKKTTFELV